MEQKDLVTIRDLTADEVTEIFDLTAEIKARPVAYKEKLAGKTLGMIFQKSSTRTRVSFEVGIYQLGGTGLFLSSSEIQLGRGETIQDTARVLSRYVDGIMIRTFAHEEVVDLAKYSSIPVINGLDDFVHPCQGLCDYFTIWEKKGSLRGVKVAYIGDGNNVAHSLIYGAARTGAHLAVATPEGYEPMEAVVAEARDATTETGCTIEVLRDPAEAAAGADVIYTDVWASMGQEEEREKRLSALKGFQVDSAMMGRAGSDCLFMHCLPAHRGEEVTDEVIESDRSVVFDQAENRLHVQKAIMVLLMG